MAFCHSLYRLSSAIPEALLQKTTRKQEDSRLESEDRKVNCALPNQNYRP